MWQATSEIRLDALMNWTPERLRRCDPYLVWAEASTDPPEPPVPPPPSPAELLNVAVLVELHHVTDYRDFLDRINGRGTGPLHFLPSGVEQGDSLFITGLVTRTGLKWLVDEVVNNRISRFTLQDPRDSFGLGGVQADWYAQLAGIRPIDERLMEEQTLLESLPKGPDAYRLGTYLGVIDDGLPFARMRPLLDAQGAGLRLWDQGWLGRRQAEGDGNMAAGIPVKPDDAYWRSALDFFWFPPAPIHVRGFFYGRRIKALLSGASTVQSDGGDTDYAVSDYFDPPPRYSHGAAVLGLMAPWLSGARQPVSWPDYISGLAMVQLPTRTVSDTSGGSLAMRVLDGLRFILWQEEVDRPAASDPRPVAVNISYGVHAGPHDGTSMIERAMEELLCHYKYLHLVLPAGNAHRAGCHAQRKLAAHGDEASIRLRVLPDNASDTFVEIWVPDKREIKLALRPPGETTPFKISKGQALFYTPPSTRTSSPRTVQFGAVYPDEVAQGKNGTMVLVVIGATRKVPYVPSEAARGMNQQPRVNVSGQAGLWELTVTNLSQVEVTVNAWVERGDAPPDQTGGSRQAYFPDSCVDGLQSDNATPEGTLNGIATLRHERAHVIGAMRRDGPLSDYSAADVDPQPPRKLELPRVVAPADWSLNVPGLRTLGFTDGAITRINGTSAACAVYTRALAEQLHIDSSKLPEAEPPKDGPRREVDCAPERQPKACDKLRGKERRMLFESEIDPTLVKPP